MKSLCMQEFFFNLQHILQLASGALPGKKHTFHSVRASIYIRGHYSSARDLPLGGRCNAFLDRMPRYHGIATTLRIRLVTVSCLTVARTSRSHEEFSISFV